MGTSNQQLQSADPGGYGYEDSVLGAIFFLDL